MKVQNYTSSDVFLDNEQLTLSMGQALAWTCELAEGATLIPGVETTCAGRLVLTQDNLDEAQVTGTPSMFHASEMCLRISAVQSLPLRVIIPSRYSVHLENPMYLHLITHRERKETSRATIPAARNK